MESAFITAGILVLIGFAVLKIGGKPGLVRKIIGWALIISGVILILGGLFSISQILVALANFLAFTSWASELFAGALGWFSDVTAGAAEQLRGMR